MRLAAVFLTTVLAAQEKPPEKITLPTAEADLARGKALYLGSCTYCHGPTGDGGKGANLARPELARAKTDGDLVRIIETGIPGTEMPGAWHMVRRELLQTAAFVRTLGKVEVTPVPGDAARGKALYDKHGCATCHTVKQGNAFAGGLMGPDLSAIGLRRSAAHLRESLVNPGASLPEDFVNTVVILKSGKTVSGRRLGEDTFSVLLRDAAGNNHVFSRSGVREVKRIRGESPMPSYQDKLSASELDDLICHLASLKEAQ
ncbi:MAG: c-type cytochrome [Acidobacteria bacterium]|nr:c-type cytochrome [Acidobacteriota bacterium]